MNGVKTHLSLSERFKFKYFCANDNNNAHLEYMTMISHDWLAKVCVCVWSYQHFVIVLWMSVLVSVSDILF